jgi:zinc protease
MQLMAAMLSDPAYRTDQWASLMASSDRSEAAMPFSAGSVMQFHLERLLHDNDLRWTVNTKAQRDSWKPEESVAFIRPIVETSPIEVIIVGDIDVETAIAETAKTLGALPPRPERREPRGLRDVKFPAGGVEVLTHKGRDDQGYAMIAWPTGQGMLANVRESRIGWALGQMMRDEATRQLRSNSGSTYSPSAAIEFPSELAAYGYIGLLIEIPPNMIDGVLAQMEGIAASLAAAPVFNSEVERLIGPRIEQTRRDAASNPAYWVQTLAGAQTDARKLDALRTHVSDYESITPEDVQNAAKRWLKPETAWKLRVVPE